MVVHNLTKDRNNESFYTGSLNTGNAIKTERVLVSRIPLTTYFGAEPKEFHDMYSARGSIKIDLNISVKNNNVPIEKTEYIFESDNVPIANRNAKITDVVLVYVTVKIPVKTGTVEKSNGYYHMDFNPTTGHKHTIAINGFERFIPAYLSDEAIVIDEVDNKELLVKQMNIYMRPVRIRDKDSNNKIIKGTERSTVLYHTDQDYWFDSQDGRYDPTMLRLGKVVMHDNSSIKENMTILDTRTRGGGLDESLTRKIIKDINEESLFNYDIGYFDGEAYQENGVVIIKLPTTLKDKYGENYQSLVQEVVSKHKAYGVLPIVEFYDPESISTGRFALLPNHDFSNGEQLSYYDPALSTHNKVVSSSEGYLIDIPVSKQYGFKIPAYRLEDVGSVRIKPYVQRLSTVDGLMGKVKIHYHNELTGDYEIDKPMRTQDININDWHEFEFIFDLFEGMSEEQKKQTEVEHIDVVLYGPMKVDYVSVRVHNDYNHTNMEVIEI